MTKITEDYVSFETAKLLKEKGLKENYYNGFYQDGITAVVESYETTIYIAMKWLREKYRLNIEILIAGLVESPNIPVKWKYRIYDSINNIDYGNITVFDTYEKACEAAIRHCLENLI